MHRNVEHARLEIPERDVDDPYQPDRELLRPIDLPQPMPQPLATIDTLADELGRRIRSTMSASIGPLHSWYASPTAPLSVVMRSTAVVRAGCEPRRPRRQAYAGDTAGSEIRSTSIWLSAWRLIIIRMITSCQVLSHSCEEPCARPTCDSMWAEIHHRSVRVAAGSAPTAPTMLGARPIHGSL